MESARKIVSQRELSTLDIKLISSAIESRLTRDLFTLQYKETLMDF